MNIKVRDLKHTDVINNENKLMVLVDDDLNLVKNITKEEFLTNVISSAENNALTQEQDGNLYVNTSKIGDDLAALSDEVDTIETNIGSLADLTTEDKTNIVAAINEAVESVESGGTSRNIGEIVASTIPLTDAGLHLLDGALINGSGIYSAFVDYIAELVSTYPDLFITEADWQISVTTYGVCGKFVYDSTNNTVRLPKVTGIIEGTTDVTALGDLVQAGLPNITGNSGNIRFMSNSRWANGALATTYTGEGSYAGTGTRYEQGTLNIDASRSSSLYKDNFNKVQPQTIKGLLYIVIATSTKTDIEVDIDQIATDLNGKADVDFVNINDTAKIVMAHNSMPSNKYIDLTLNASGSTYTAPADGYFYFSKNTTKTGQWAIFEEASDGIPGQVGFGVPYNDYLVNIIRPVAKGTSMKLKYTAAGATAYFRFVYAKGSESEAN